MKRVLCFFGGLASYICHGLWGQNCRVNISACCEEVLHYQLEERDSMVIEGRMVPC